MRTQEQEQAIYNRAVDVWAEYCKTKGLVQDQPNWAWSSIGRRYVHLFNSSGLHVKIDMRDWTVKE